MFLVNSRHPLVCAPGPWLPRNRAPFSRSYGGNLPSSFNTVLSSASVYSTSPPVSVSGTVLAAGLFPGSPQLPTQSDKDRQPLAFVTSGRPRNIDLVPIDYAFRPRLRGRLTLSGLALLRNPWTCGDRVSHPVCRYSCQHSHFRYLHGPSRVPLRRPTERSATIQKTDARCQMSETSGPTRRPPRPPAGTLRRRPANIRAISWYSSRQRRQSSWPI